MKSSLMHAPCVLELVADIRWGTGDRLGPTALKPKALNLVQYPVLGGPDNDILRSASLVAARSGWGPATLQLYGPGSGADRWPAAGLEVIQLCQRRLLAMRNLRADLRDSAHRVQQRRFTSLVSKTTKSRYAAVEDAP